MSDYSQVNDYSAKDALASGNPEKLILGSDIDDELSGISVAIASKYDSADLASQAQAEAETSNTTLITPLRLANWADYNAGVVGDLQGIADPNADVILGWDDSAGAAIGFALSTGLTTSGTNLLIDTAVVPQLAAANTFTATGASSAALSISADSPWLNINETDQGTNSKLWHIGASGGSLIIAADNDGGGSLISIPVAITRSGTTISSIALTATAITLNGVDATDFARLSQSNTVTANANASLGFTLANNSAGSSAAMNIRLNNGTTATQFIQTGTGATVSGIGIANAPATAGTWLGTNSTTPFVIGTNNAAALVISGSQNFDFKGGTVTTNNESASEVGFKGMPAASDETPVLTDAGKVIIAGGNVTIPANDSVAYPVGTVMTIINNTASGITIAVTTDSMIWAATGGTGTRTLAGRGIATVIKSASTTWYIAGTGLS